MSRTGATTAPARLGRTPDDYPRIGLDPRSLCAKAWEAPSARAVSALQSDGHARRSRRHEQELARRPRHHGYTV
jgi:hypothetical protein